MTSAPPNVFSEIALSLSGGGYRAAAFHLGTLRMLHRLNLLDSVKILSTVSGGTITGAAYACWLADGGGNFDDFSREFKKFLLNNHIISEALSNLCNAPAINGISMMPSLIRSAARIYAENSSIKNKTLDSLINGNKKQFKEVVFNSTDFRTGNCFRFQISDNIGVRTGNNRGKVKSEINKHIRVADIIAASSCFPGGFEPIRFPGDFVWPESSGLANIRDALGAKFNEEIPLMDGGVFDNQGIDSVLNIYRRKDNEIDLYIISDTSQRDTDILKAKIKERYGVFSVKHLHYLTLIIALVAVLTASSLFISFVQRSGQISLWNIVFVYFIPFVISSLIGLLIIIGNVVGISFLKSVSRKHRIEVWRNVKNLRLPEVAELILTRFSSLSVMTTQVFMKRIRDMGFNRIFADENLRKKAIPIMIYDLDNPPKWGRVMRNENLIPTQKLRDIAVLAEQYPTNLWVTDEEEFESLIKCGEATTCFQVLKYLKEQKSSEISVVGSPLKQLHDTALEFWNHYQVHSA